MNPPPHATRTRDPYSQIVYYGFMKWCRIRGMLLAVCVFMLMSLPVSPLSPAAQELIRQRELVIALDQSYVNFNPHEAWSIEMAQVFSAMSEGLFSYHPATMEPLPALAASVENLDPYTWRIFLRRDGRFSNGDPITAHTFVDSWRALIAPGASHQYASMLDIIRGVREYRTRRPSRDQQPLGFYAEDTYTLMLELTAPAPYLLSILCHHSFSAVHPDNLASPSSETPSGFISSGPFAVESVSGDEILMVRNPYYWDAASVALERVRFRYYDSPLALVGDFEQALVHWSLQYIQPSLISDRSLLTGYPEYSTGFYYFSAVRGPYADPRVRTALSLLVPWEALRNPQIFFAPASSLVPPTASYYGAQGPVRQDRARAQQLLAQAGFPEGRGLPPLKIAVYPGSLLEQTTRSIAEIWSNELRIEVSVDVRPYSEYASGDTALQYDLAFMSWIGDFFDPYSFLALWHSESSLNLGSQFNPIYDSMVERALKTYDVQERYQQFVKAEQYLLDQGTVLPLFHGVSLNFFQDALVGGWIPNLLDIHPIKYLYFIDRSPASEERRL